MTMRPYTPADIKVMRRMVAEKRPLKEIAAALGRTYMAIRSQVCERMMTRRNPWDDPVLTERLIAYRKAGDTYYVIAAELNMTDHQIKNKAKRLMKKGLL